MKKVPTLPLGYAEAKYASRSAFAPSQGEAGFKDAWAAYAPFSLRSGDLKVALFLHN
jgi:hypothetical protein